MTRAHPVATPDAARLASLVAIHAAAFAPERGWSAAEIATLASTGLLIVAEGDTGFALLSRAADEAEILTIAVAPEAQGCGVGAALLAAAMVAAASDGAVRLFLEVAEDNAPARRLYATAGFTEIARRPRYYQRPDSKMDALVLSRPLD